MKKSPRCGEFWGWSDRQGLLNQTIWFNKRVIDLIPHRVSHSTLESIFIVSIVVIRAF